MTRFQNHKLLWRAGVTTLCCAWLLTAVGRADEAKPAEARTEQSAPYTDWRKLVDTLRQHYVDKQALTPERLDEAFVRGVLELLGEGAQIVERTAAQPASGKGASPLARAETIGDTIGYLRFEDINSAAASALDQELARMKKESLNGLVLDLRFADGTDFIDAAAVASRFLPQGAPVFTLKSDGSEKEFRNTDIDGFTAPIAVLVNRQTRGCAEAVAAALRAQGRAIVIGNRSAGSAAVHSDILLDEKHVLRVATGKIIFPGALEVFPKGLTPDIEVEISEQTERDFLISKPPKKTLTELFQPAPTRPRVNEAELVRAQRGEATTLMQPAATPSEPPQEIPDTVLQRAVDLLKGLTALSPDAASGN